MAGLPLVRCPEGGECGGHDDAEVEGPEVLQMYRHMW
jgi:hypothetical protein